LSISPHSVGLAGSSHSSSALVPALREPFRSLQIDHARNIARLRLQKMQKKVKKSLSGLFCSNKPEAARTNRPNPPFKKTLKKVKKKLVSALEI